MMGGRRRVYVAGSRSNKRTADIADAVLKEVAREAERTAASIRQRYWDFLR